MPGPRGNRVILVDEREKAIGAASKAAVHRGKGRLHRAFSIFIFDRKRRLLIQKRSGAKYHFAGVWANTCCSHPRPGESVPGAAHRRLQEEMGFDCPLVEQFSFIYRAESANGLTEHEYDHVLTGTFTGTVVPDESEVEAWKWIAPRELLRAMDKNPDDFAPWLRIAAPRLFSGMRVR